MHFIILLLLLHSCSYLCAMDQGKNIDVIDDKMGVYIFDAVEKYKDILDELVKQESKDPALWLKSCEQAGKLKACFQLGLINDPSLKASIPNILENHKKATSKISKQMRLEYKPIAPIEKE